MKLIYTNGENQDFIMIENKAKEKGCKRLILETGKLLKHAIGLYTSLGYKIIENYGQYKNMPLSICMSKDI